MRQANPWGGGGGLSLIVGMIAGLIVAPVLVVVPMSFSASRSLEFPPPSYGFGYYRAFATSESWLIPLLNSVMVASATAVLTMAIVAPAAMAMVRYRFPGKSVARVLIMMPLAVPSIVMALSYYLLYAKVGMNHSYAGLILAHSCGAIPIAFLVVSAALKGFDRNLERAAASLGAGPFTRFRRITLPILRPAFLVGALFSFVHSFDEAVIAIFISGRDVTTLPRKMFDSIANEADPVIAVVSTLLLAAVAAGFLLRAMAGAGLFARRRPALAVEA